MCQNDGRPLKFPGIVTATSAQTQRFITSTHRLCPCVPCSTPYWQSLSCFLLTTGVRTPGELLRRPSARIGLIQSNSIRASSRKEVPSAAIGMYRVRGKHEEKTRWCCSPLSVCMSLLTCCSSSFCLFFLCSCCLVYCLCSPCLSLCISMCERLSLRLNLIRVSPYQFPLFYISLILTPLSVFFPLLRLTRLQNKR